jgi:hypothetical protein
MRIAWWIPKATNTLSEYVIHIAFPRQLRLRERASMLNLYLPCLSRVLLSAFFRPLPKYINENVMGRGVLRVTLLFYFLVLYITVRCWNIYLTKL